MESEYRVAMLGLDTGEPPAPYETSRGLIAIVEAGRKAQRTRQRVHLREITG